MTRKSTVPVAPAAPAPPPAAPIIDAAPEYTPDGSEATQAVAAPSVPEPPKTAKAAKPKQKPAIKKPEEAEAPEPVVGNEAYAMMMDPPEMQMSQTNHLRYLKKKVHDGLVEPARGVIVGTGIIGVDMIMQRGVNFGSAHEFFGFSKTAKSYLMQKIAVEGQRTLPDCYVVVLDRENAYDRDRVLSVGFDPNRTIVIPSRIIPEPDHVFDVMREQTEELERLHLKMLENNSDDDDDDAKEDPTNKKEAKKKGKDLYCRDYDAKKSPHIIFIIDSLPAFSEQEDMVEDQGRRAKKWHAVLRRVTGFLDAKIMVLFSNHVIYKPGMFGGPAKTSGLSPDYYRDCGIELHKLTDIKDESGVTIGAMIHATVDKTRRGASGAPTFFPIYFKGGAPRFSGIMPYAQYLGIAEVTNEKAVKEGKWGRVWANYRVKGITGTISEQDSSALEAYVRANNILPMIGAREKELIK